MDRPCHGAAHRCLQGMARQAQPLYSQTETALSDDDFAIFDFHYLGTQLGGKAVFFPVQQNHTNDPGKVERAQGDICH